MTALRRALALLLAAIVNVSLVAALVALNRDPSRTAAARAPVTICPSALRDDAPPPPEAERAPEPPPNEAFPPPETDLALPPLPPPTAPVMPPLDLATSFSIDAVVLPAAPPLARPAVVPSTGVVRAAPGPAARRTPTRPPSNGAVEVAARWDPSNRQPLFPGVLQRRGATGEVTLAFVITKDGRVRSPRVTDAKGSDRFVREVLKVAASWRFTPARHRGRAVAVRATHTCVFALSERRRR